MTRHDTPNPSTMPPGNDGASLADAVAASRRQPTDAEPVAGMAIAYADAEPADLAAVCMACGGVLRRTPADDTPWFAWHACQACGVAVGLPRPADH